MPVLDPSLPGTERAGAMSFKLIAAGGGGSRENLGAGLVGAAPRPFQDLAASAPSWTNAEAGPRRWPGRRRKDQAATSAGNWANGGRLTFRCRKVASGEVPREHTADAAG